METNNNITPHMEVAIAIAYKKGSSLSCLAMKYHCSSPKIRGILVKHDVKIRPQMKPPNYLPTEEEIWGRRTKAIQGGWDERTRKARDCYDAPPITLPTVSTRQLSHYKPTLDV